MDNLIDLRSAIYEAIYDEVGPVRHLAAPFVAQGEATEAALEAQYTCRQGMDQG